MYEFVSTFMLMCSSVFRFLSFVTLYVGSELLV